MILSSAALLMNRWLTLWLGGWSALQYCLVYWQAAPDLAQLSGPSSILATTTGLPNVLVRCLMLLSVGVFGALAVQLLRTTLARLAAQQTLRREEALARARAEQASETKSALLAHLGHEIRTPLNAIVGYVEAIQRGEDRAGDVAHIRAGAAHVRTIVDQILEQSRAEATHRPVEFGPVPIRQLAHSTAELLRPAAARARVPIAVVLASEVPEIVHTDAVRLRQVLLNLLSNAVKATTEGEVALWVLAPAFGTIRFEIRDTGTGIAPADLPRIFERCEQGEEQEQGTGLGLAISHELVAELGGHLEANSILGLGSTFSFQLPVHTTPVSPQSDREAPEGPAVATDAGSLITPAPAHLDELLHLARRGNLGGVASLSGAFAADDARLTAFHRRVEQLVEAIDDHGLTKFLEHPMCPDGSRVEVAGQIADTGEAPATVQDGPPA